MMKPIDEFLSRYKQEKSFYSEAAKYCAERCEAVLGPSGIRAIVTDRPKREDRLEAKLNDRNKRKSYKTVDDIFNDISDLAGVRIALYFPDDRSEVDTLIDTNFIVEETKTFPEKKRGRKSKLSYEKRFSGYWAKHYRVRLKVDDLGIEKRFENAVIEIQVASVLMHAWAEVEHDLLYKPLTGNPSTDERAILDEINGLVMAGEIAL